MKLIATIVATGGLLALAAAPAVGQNRAPVDQRVQDQRYAIGVVERVLEQAVEHGASRTRNRLQAVLPPADMLLAGDARVRGFRQEGYGVFFDVEVPDLDTSLPWSFNLLDQSGLGLNSALQQLRTVVEKTGDTNAEQALKRIELEVVPSTAMQAANIAGSSSALALPVGSAAATSADAPSLATPPPAPPPSDPILNNPAEAYRAEIREALIDAMLQHSRGLNIGPTEWLHVAAKRNDGRTRLAAVNTDDATMHIRVRGADLSAYLGGQITREEAVARIEVKLF
jgi:hypothetical protein